MARYGPPQPRPRAYPYVLEVLETQANKKLLGEYSGDVKQWLSVLEQQLAVNPQMIDIQPEIQWFMRPYLLDFLIELHSLFRLQPATLFLCVNIIDRYCAKRIVFKRHYQLVGCTALWIAGKYEDKKLRVPTLRELAIMCRHAYDEEMFVQMEMHILSTLEWSLSHPLLEECLQLAIAEAGVSSHVTPCKYNRLAGQHDPHTLKVSAVTAVGRFFCELSLYDRFFLTVPASLVAVAANLMACAMLGVPTAAAHLRDLMANMPAFRRDEQLQRLLAGQEAENEAPSVYGPFLLGLDAQALHTIRRIALVLFLHTGSLSEVVHRKFEGLGVIPVIHNFSNRHAATVQAVFDAAADLTLDDAAQPLLPEMLRAADVLLLLGTPEKRLAPPPLAPYHTNILPQTPPLATSQSLVFSRAGGSAYATPVLTSDSAQFPAYSPIADCDLGWALPIPSKTR